MSVLNRKFRTACKYDPPLKIKKYLNKGANINAIDPQTGNTGLLEACLRGRQLTVEFLMAQNADISIRNKKGENILTLAAKSKNIALLEKLLSHPNICALKIPADDQDILQKNLNSHFFETIIHTAAKERQNYDKNRATLVQKTPKINLKRKKITPPNKKP